MKKKIPADSRDLGQSNSQRPHVCLCEGVGSWGYRQFELSCGRKELNLGPLEGQPETFTAEPSLQSVESFSNGHGFTWGSW